MSLYIVTVSIGTNLSFWGQFSATFSHGDLGPLHRCPQTSPLRNARHFKADHNRNFLKLVHFVIGLVAKKEDPTLIGNYCAGTNTQTDRLTIIGILLVMTAVILSGITLITLNVIILRTAMRHARRIAQMQQAVGAGQDDTTSRVKASQIVTIITVGFLICYTPTSILHIILGFDIEGRLFSRPFDDVTIFIFYCSSALNPIIYCYRDRVFRENALRYFQDKAVWRNLCSAESTFV